MEPRAAWILNLDADLELARGPGYAPSARVTASMRPHVESLARKLLEPGDVLLSDGDRAEGFVGRAFCPTPRAIEALRRAGADVAPHPPVEVLRLVNARGFCAELGETMEDASFVTTEEAAWSVLARSPRLSDAWRIKRAFGMAGRGHRVVTPSSLTRADTTTIRAGIAEGGVQIEPNVALVTEYAIHGMLDAHGEARLGRVCVQRCDAHGQWRATEPLQGGDPAIVRALVEEAERVAEALAKAAYFGPFNVDAFTYRDRQGRVRFQPRSEINARYSMGFAVGFRGP